VYSVTNLPASSLAPYLRQAGLKGFTLVEQVLALIGLVGWLAVLAAPRCIDPLGKTKATSFPS
jgi:hypothetical protein